MTWSRRRILVAGVVGALLAFAVTVIALNFVQPERRIQQQVEHRYTTGDPRFRHELSTLLGPGGASGAARTRCYTRRS